MEDKLVNFVEDRLKEADTAHDFGHIKRVVNLVKYIGEKESANLKLLIPAAYLHDISYRDEVSNHDEHVDNSLRIAEKYLTENSEAFGLSEQEIKKILEIIKSGSSEYYIDKEDFSSISIEEKILQDAGILDAMGAIGIARAFSFGGHFRNSLENTIKYINENILKRFDKLQTKTAKEVGKQRIEFVKLFLEQFNKETI